MEDIGGLVYLLNTLGNSLAEANRQIADLTRQREQLIASISRCDNTDDSPP